ncbi:MAG: class II glutamine amidotransferase [Methylocystaceae bacterium]|jgi:methylamine---glutamate N-methyltransferase subunit A|nr:class II glutamine amidotransferase [Methylocystaceae bacterium]
MCGIAGILFKKGAGQATVGKSLVSMLDGCQHRGEDSTGFALYGETDEYLHLRFLVGDEGQEEAIEGVKKILADHGAQIVKERIDVRYYVVSVLFDGDVQKFTYDLEGAAKLISAGRTLDIIKDEGTSHEVDALYHVSDFKGSHGIGHVRLATESAVKPESAHPFLATGFTDIAIVHNGQITNYWKMRRRLERRGFEFRTDNDSELCAVYLADKLSQQITLENALEEAIEDLDGTFSFLVSTENEIGFAKDHLAAKPMVLFENDDLIAVASEEVSLNRLFPGIALNTTEPAPGTFKTWQR